MRKVLMIATVLASWHKPTSQEALGGYAKFYAEDVMKRVAVNRGYIKDTSEYYTWLESLDVHGAASLMRRGDIGRIFRIKWPNGTITRHISIDCADFRHFFSRWSKGDVVEVDWDVAQVMGMSGPVRVTVIFDD